MNHPGLALYVPNSDVSPYEQLRNMRINPNIDNVLQILLSEQYMPIREHLMRMLDTRDLLNLCRTCRSINHSIKSIDWNITRKLERFFKNPTAFRRLQAVTGALISGSFALQFLARVVWLDSDLDIMVQEGMSAENIKQHVQHNEGYELQSVDSGYDELGAKFKVYTYLGSGQKLQVIQTVLLPLDTILSDFYTTAVVNFISWNKTYSVFPRPTFLSYDTIRLKPPTQSSSHYEKLYKKYHDRGWNLRTFGVPEATLWDMGGTIRLDDDCRVRYVGDKHTWIMYLDKTGINPPHRIPDSVMECSGFNIEPPSITVSEQGRLSSWKSFGLSMTYTLSVEEVRLPSLRYTYLSGMRDPFWQTMQSVCQTDALAQLLMLQSPLTKSGTRPRQVALDDSFRHPPGWVFLDDQVPTLMKRWRRSERLI